MPPATGTQPDPYGESGPPTAEILAAKVQNVTQNVGPLLDKRTRPSASEPSAVEWIDPEAMRLTAAPARPTSDVKPAVPDVPPTVVPLVRPTVENSPTVANQVAYVPASGDTVALANNEAHIGGPVTAGMRVPADASNQAVSALPASTGDSLEQKFAQRVRDYPRDTGAQLDYQLLQFLHDEQVPQLDALAPLQAEDRELISATMDGLSNFRNALRSGDNARFSAKVAPLIEMADRLRSQAELNIPTLALCSKVDGFGAYDPIEPARFVAGKDHMVVLYCEVENFTSRQDAKQLWVTRFQQEAVLYTETGLPIWEDKTKGIVDMSRNRRHDFFIVKLVKLPANLTVGRYLMKVSVVDQLPSPNRIAEKPLQVQIVSQ
jgi:hypothetical protein